VVGFCGCVLGYHFRGVVVLGDGWVVVLDGCVSF